MKKQLQIDQKGFVSWQEIIFSSSASDVSRQKECYTQESHPIQYHWGW